VNLFGPALFLPKLAFGSLAPLDDSGEELTGSLRLESTSLVYKIESLSPKYIIKTPGLSNRES
jgi:hypothetical protein